MSDLLKLQAKDADDLQVISAVLQDAIAPVVDMHFFADDKNFVMVVQRLCRDGEKKERICCALNLSGVTKVETHGFHPSETGTMLDLLAVIPEGDELHLVFASDARIRLTLQNWSMIVEDFGERWPAQCDPCHEGDG